MVTYKMTISNQSAYAKRKTQSTETGGGVSLMAKSPSGLLCDPCEENLSDAVVLCKECRELYCNDCATLHKALKSNKHHIIVKISNDENVTSLDAKIPICDACILTGKGKKDAEFLCQNCRELYCDSCKRNHSVLRATKHHHLHKIVLQKEYADDTVKECQELSNIFENVHILDETFSGAQAPVLQTYVHKIYIKGSLSKFDIDNASAKIIDSFNAKLPSDKKDCLLTGLVCLSDGRIITLDKSNRCLKMFDSNFENKTVVETLITCCGMTKVSEDSIAVVGEDVIFFYRVSTDELILSDKILEIGNNGYGISFNGDHFAITCGSSIDEIDKITVLDKDGKEVKSITKLRISPDEYICIDSDENIGISSFRNDKVFFISDTGELKLEKHIRDPRDIIQFYNCLLVSSENSIIVCKVDENYSRPLIADGENLNDPEFMAYNPNTQKLYFVTKFLNNVVTVLQVTFQNQV